MIYHQIPIFVVSNFGIYLPAIEIAIEKNGGKLVGVQSNLNQMSLDREIKKTKAEVLIITLDEQKDESTHKLIEKIQKENPLVRIIVIAKKAKDTLRLIETEVKGLVLVNEHFNELTRAMKMITQGENYYSPKVSQAMARKIKNRPVSLTPREQEVLDLSNEEKSNSEIAQMLDLKPSTVRTHLNNAKSKLR